MSDSIFLIVHTYLCVCVCVCHDCVSICLLTSTAPTSSSRNRQLTSEDALLALPLPVHGLTLGCMAGETPVTTSLCCQAPQPLSSLSLDPASADWATCHSPVSPSKLEAMHAAFVSSKTGQYPRPAHLPTRRRSRVVDDARLLARGGAHLPRPDRRHRVYENLGVNNLDPRVLDRPRGGAGGLAGSLSPPAASECRRDGAHWQAIMSAWPE